MRSRRPALAALLAILAGSAPAHAQLLVPRTPFQAPSPEPPSRPLSPYGPGGSQSLGPGGGLSMGPGGGMAVGPRGGLSDDPRRGGDAGPCGLAPLPPCVAPMR